jgi:hypothetical protein
MPAPALALLAAVAVGVILPLARPGANFAGLGALALLPGAALVLAGLARAAALAAALAYGGLFIWAYTAHFAPLYAYQGLLDARPEPGPTLVVVGLAALPAAWLPLSARRPSTIVLWSLYLVGYVPAVMVPLFLTGDLETVMPHALALLGSLAIVSLILRIRTPRLAFPHLSQTGFTNLLVALGVLSTLYVVGTFGVHSLPSFASVYDTRAAFGAVQSDSAIAGYIVPWAANAINPLLMALGLARRRIGLLALGFAGQLLIYSVTGYKEVLFSIALVPLVYAAIACARHVYGLVAVAAVPAILAVSIAANALTSDWSIALGKRVFATSGQVGWYYFDYFSVHPTYQLSHSFLGWLVPSRYEMDPSILIGSVYFPSSSPNANADFWADAFANFGFVGIAVFSVILGLLLWVLDGLGRDRDARVIGPMLAIAGLTLAASALFTSLLTQALVLGCLLIALMPPAAGEPQQRRRLERRSVGPMSTARPWKRGAPP